MSGRGHARKDTKENSEEGRALAIGSGVVGAVEENADEESDGYHSTGNEYPDGRPCIAEEEDREEDSQRENKSSRDLVERRIHVFEAVVV